MIGIRMFFVSLAIISLSICWARIEEASVISKMPKDLLPTDEWGMRIDSDAGLWRRHEFDTGIGNREELRIENIEIRKSSQLAENVTNWQVLLLNGETYLAGSQEYTFFMYHFDTLNHTTSLRASVPIVGTIKTARLISLPQNGSDSSSDDSIHLVMIVETSNEKFYLKWFDLQDDTFVEAWIMSLTRSARNLEYFCFNDRHKLLVAYEGELYYNQTSSVVEIYDISTDLFSPKLQLCHKLHAPETFDVKICQLEGTRLIISLMNLDSILLYEYKDEDVAKCHFKQVRSIKITSLTDVICFESGYMHYLSILNSSLNVFNIDHDEHLHLVRMEESIAGEREIKSIQSLPVTSYRDESVLLIQLKNSTVAVLSWQGLEFKRVSWTSQKLDHFNLAEATIIPRYGFFQGNSFVKLHTKLHPISRPDTPEFWKVSVRKSKIEEILKKQESIVRKVISVSEGEMLDDLHIHSGFELDHSDQDETTLNQLDIHSISLETKNSPLQELMTSYEHMDSLMFQLETKLYDAEETLSKNIEESISSLLSRNVEIEGDLEIKGKLLVDNLNIDILNNVAMEVLMADYCVEKNPKMEGTKYFPSVVFTDQNLKIRNLNDRPLIDFAFQENPKNFSYNDLSDIRKIHVKGDLNFTNAFDEDWQQVITNVVLKDEHKIIPGVTTVTGDTSARLIFMDNLNGIQYPSDYIVKSGPLEAVITGEKTFETLKVSDLQGVETINGIDADDFITTNADQDLKHQITFKNLVIDETFQIDGKIVGLPEQNFDPDLTLLNSNLVQSNVEITKLHVTGKIHVGNSIAGIKWSELDDLIMKDEETVLIAGAKTFLSHVQVAGNLDIGSKKINGHHEKDFITLDTPQILYNLSRISGDANFIEVTYDELEDLQNSINSELGNDGTPLCLEKSIIFTKAPLLEELSTSFINGNISASEFSDKLSSMLRFAKFENLRIRELIVSDLIPAKINNVSADGVKDRRITKLGYQNISGNITVRFLEVDRLYFDYVNSIPSGGLENLTETVNILFDSLINGNQTLRSLDVKGNVITPSINNKDLREILDLNNIDGFIFRNIGSIESVKVDGSINGFNFSNESRDIVLKTDESMILRGRKRIQKLRSQNLYVDFINERPSEDIVNNDKSQIINGAVRVKGALEVHSHFNLTGKMNDVPFQKVFETTSILGDNIHQLNGKFIVPKQISIKYLDVLGQIQQRKMPNFIDDLIRMNQKDVTIFGTKTFTNSTNFHDDIFITRTLNEIDLERFYRGATLIDQPSSLNSKIIFEDDILIQNDLNVSTVEVGSIKGLDIANLMENAIHVNRPTFISEAMTLSDVVFKSDLEIKSWNNVDMNSLFTLNADQFVKDVLICVDASVEEFNVRGLINGENLAKLYETTFSLSTDQNISGKMSFLNGIHAKRNFDSRFINGVDISKTISLDEPGSMIGSFNFYEPVVLEGRLNVNGRINDVDVSEWKSTAVMANSQVEHQIQANWIIHGNVEMTKDVIGSGAVNGFNIQELSDDLKKQRESEETFISKKMESLYSMCDDLKELEREVENKPYLFKSFENFASIFFNQKVVSFHQFSSDKVNYIMTNFEDCRLNVFAFSADGFKPLTNVSNFGYVEEYITLNYEKHSYIATMGKSNCGMSPGNVWKFENNRLRHILDLGNVTDMNQLGDDAFVVIADQKVKEWLIKDIFDNRLIPVNEIPMKDKRVRFFMNENETLLASPDTIYDLRSDVSGFDEFENPFKTNNINTFQLGVDKKEHIILYEEHASRDYFLICSGDLSRRKILQVIEAHRPSSFSVLNFDKFQQNLLVFVENKRIIQIYEYRGVEGFKHHSSIRMKVDKIFIFKMRTKKYSVETFFLAAIHDSKLSILEAKMYGDRFDMGSEFKCASEGS